MARPDPITMTTAHLLDEYLVVYRDGGRRHEAIRSELDRRFAELERLRAIEAAAREYYEIAAYEPVFKELEAWYKFSAVLEAKEHQ